jgi:hypothetical protein
MDIQMQNFSRILTYGTAGVFEENERVSPKENSIVFFT